MIKPVRKAAMQEHRRMQQCYFGNKLKYSTTEAGFCRVLIIVYSHCGSRTQYKLK